MLISMSRSVGAIFLACSAVAAPIAGAQQRSVAFAGFAYAGEFATREARFVNSTRYEADLRSAGATAYQRISGLITANPPRQLHLVANIDALKGADQVIVTALVVTNETTSVEQFGAFVKVLALVRAQALFFDFKSQTVLRAYPLSFAYIDTLDHVPDADEVYERYRKVFEGAGDKPGLFARYAATLASAQLPVQVPRFIQVTQVTISPEVLARIPDSFKASSTSAQSWLADLISEAISSRTGVPVLPFAPSYSVNNVMAVAVSDGDVYNLTLPHPDYAFVAALTRLKKVKYGESPAGASFIYGAYGTVTLTQPMSGREYLNTGLKNGEVKLVPAMQTYVDDFPAYFDAVNAMFAKLADAMDGKGDAWIKSAATAPDIERQIAQAKELILSCK
jgi:hypothetical protein